MDLCFPRSCDAGLRQHPLWAGLQHGPGAGGVISRPGAIAAGVKILGYLEDDRAIPTLLTFVAAKGNAAAALQIAPTKSRLLIRSPHRRGRAVQAAE